MNKVLILIASLSFAASPSFAARDAAEDLIGNALKELQTDVAKHKAGDKKNADHIESAAVMKRLHDVRAELKKRRPELSKTLIEKWTPKILSDIDFIMKKGWAETIDKDDFFHAHIVFPHEKVNADTIAQGTEVIFLYHTREGLDRDPVVPNRDIISTLTSEPVALNESKETVNAWNLKGWEFGFVAWDKDRETVKSYAAGYEVEASARGGGMLFGLMSPPLLQ